MENKTKGQQKHLDENNMVSTRRSEATRDEKGSTIPHCMSKNMSHDMNKNQGGKSSR